MVFLARESWGRPIFLATRAENAAGVVLALVRDGKEVSALNRGESGAVVLNQTPFYAKSGGQVGDTGVLSGDGVKFSVTETEKLAGDLFVHFGAVEAGNAQDRRGA